MTHLIGLISDTHGLLRPECFAALKEVERILHAGDVGGHDILIELGAIAPVDAVYGNTDPLDDPHLRQRLIVEIGGLKIHVSHGHELGRPTPQALFQRYRDADIIVYGHTHRALVGREGSRLAVNPGAAGPRRFNIQPSIARLTIADGRADVEIVKL